jgi:hypothetical protein
VLHDVELAEFRHFVPTPRFARLDGHAGIERDTPPRIELGGGQCLDLPSRSLHRLGAAGFRRVDQRRQVPSAGHGQALEEKVLVPLLFILLRFNAKLLFHPILVLHILLPPSLPFSS